MLAPSEPPGTMQALEVAGIDKPEQHGWWQWLTARLRGDRIGQYTRIEETEVGPTDRISSEGMLKRRVRLLHSSHAC